jgi:hypothetical protein
MHINVVSSQVNYYQKNKVNDSNKKFNIEDNVNDFRVEDDRVANPSMWNELAQKYDITNASFNEICTISRKLYDAKQISLLEHSQLSFMPRALANHLKNIQKIMPDAKNHPLLTLRDTTNNWEEEKINWIEEFEAKMELSKKGGCFRAYNNQKKVVGFLKRLA